MENLLTPKEKMLNWARDFFQYYQKREGGSSKKNFEERFKRFKKAYYYEGTSKEILDELKNSGYISIEKGLITWLL